MKPCPHCGTMFDPVATHHPNRSSPGGSSHPMSIVAFMMILTLPCVYVAARLAEAWTEGLSLVSQGHMIIIAMACAVSMVVSLAALLTTRGDWYVAMCPKCYQGVALTYRDLNP